MKYSQDSLHDTCTCISKMINNARPFSRHKIILFWASILFCVFALESFKSDTTSFILVWTRNGVCSFVTFSQTLYLFSRLEQDCRYWYLICCTLYIMFIHPNLLIISSKCYSGYRLYFPNYSAFHTSVYSAMFEIYVLPKFIH